MLMMHWWGIPFSHEVCGIEGSVVEVYGNCKGQIMFECVCIQCGTKYMTAPLSVSEIIIACFKRDTESGERVAPLEELESMPVKGKPC